MFKKLVNVIALAASLFVAAPVQAATCTPTSCVTMHDTIPNFAANPTITAISSGDWNDPAIWDKGVIPNPNDVVSIPMGLTVEISTTSAVADVVGVNGVLRFSRNFMTSLEVATLMVMPGGTFDAGTPTSPNTAFVEVLFRDKAINQTKDPLQFGTGFISVDGTVNMVGEVKTSFVRLAEEPLVGQTTLTLETPATNWHMGERIFLPDSQAWTPTQGTYQFRGEEFTITYMSPDMKTVGLSSAIRFQHPGARDGDDVLRFLPHVGNVSRNILFRSQNPLGTRGHIFLTEKTDLNIQNVEFRNLGRTTWDLLDNSTVGASGNLIKFGTNHIGRYPLHIHHVYGSSNRGTQFTLIGNSVWEDGRDSKWKWGITIHGSHFGLIQENVVYNSAGWGIGTEDGSESYNLFRNNFVARVYGKGGRESSEAANGYWFRGPMNRVVGNVAANILGQGLEASHGFHIYQVYLGSICVPRFPGAVMGQCNSFNAYTLPLLEFANNEAYGGFTNIGLAFWWLGSDAYNPSVVSESLIKNFTGWNLGIYGIYGYPAAKVTIDGLTVIGRRSSLANASEITKGVFLSDYMLADLTIKNADIQNMNVGVYAPYFSRGTFTLLNSNLRNVVNYRTSTIGAPGAWPNAGNQLPIKQAVIRDTVFKRVTGTTVPQYDIHMDYTTWFGTANLIKSDKLYVYNFNKVAGDDFQVFYRQQEPNFVVPQTAGNLTGSPVAGLTNAQNWSTYGIAIAGAVGPTTTRPGIFGYVLPGTPAGFPEVPVLVPSSTINTLTVVPDTFVIEATDPIPAYTYSVTGFVNGDTQAVVTGNAVCSSSAVAGFPGTYPITCSVGTLKAQGYQFQFGYGSLLIKEPVPPTPPPTQTGSVLDNQPTFRSVSVGQSLTFSVSVQSATPVTYQWQKNNRPITGATSSTYTTPPLTAGDTGAIFRCIINNAAGRTVTGGVIVEVK